MSPGESYNIHPPQYNTARTTTVNISQISALPGNTADCPPTTLPQQLQFTFLIFSALPGNSAN